MSRWPLEGLRRPARRRVIVGLDAQGMAWRFDGMSPSSVVDTTETAALAQQLVPRAHVDVIVANDVAVHWLQTPPAGVQSLKELRQIAAARCAHLFGGVPAAWWVAGDWSASRAFVCAGLPLDRVGPLQRALTDGGARTTWHTAWGLLCSARARTLPADGWSAMHHAGRMVVWCCRHGRVTALNAVHLGAKADEAEAEMALAQWQRIEALRDPELVPGPVHWARLPTGESHAGSAALALASWVTGAAR